jgi:RNA polymerase sigma factor (sigma-70 family)
LTPWAELHGEYHSQIRSWFAARVASEQDADDLAEEVLARLAHGRTPDDLKAYIATAAANALARYWRRRAKDRNFLRRLLGETTGADEMRGSESKDQPEKGESSKERGGAEKILSTLPPGQAELLRLHFLEGLCMAEVARRVGCSREVAYKRLQRIIQRLRKRYAVEPPGPVHTEDSKDS